MRRRPSGDDDGDGGVVLCSRGELGGKENLVWSLTFVKWERRSIKGRQLLVAVRNATPESVPTLSS